MSDNVLKKEFKEHDVNRVRNLVKKDYGAKTKTGSGYSKARVKYEEGDVWEEDGRTWTIKNGIKQNITKLDKAKKEAQIPLTCPKCKTSMNYWLHKKMYRIHGFCFDCTVDYEAELRKAGLYEQYEKAMLRGGQEAFIKDIEAWIFDSVNTQETFVSEEGEVDTWIGAEKTKKAVLEKLQDFLEISKKAVDG